MTSFSGFSWAAFSESVGGIGGRDAPVTRHSRCGREGRKKLRSNAAAGSAERLKGVKP